MSARVHAVKRVFVDGASDRETADGLAARMAALLVRAGLTRRYGVSVSRIPTRRDDEGWGVYLTDRTPDEDPPEGLRFVTPVRRTARLRAA